MRVLILKWDRLSVDALTSVVRETVDAAEVLVAQRAREALHLLRLAPVALLLTGVDGPDLDGLDFIPEIMDSRLTRQTLIISERSDGRTLGILKRMPYDGLMDGGSADSAEYAFALQSILGGQRYTSPVFRRPPTTQEMSAGAMLSPHEEKVLALLGEGIDDNVAAVRLNLSPNTVRNHRARIMFKLGLHCRGELVQYAFANLYVRATSYGILHPGFDRELGAFADRTAMTASAAG